MKYEIIVEKKEVFSKIGVYYSDVLTYIDNDDEHGSIVGSVIIEKPKFISNENIIEFDEFMIYWGKEEYAATVIERLGTIEITLVELNSNWLSDRKNSIKLSTTIFMAARDIFESQFVEAILSTEQILNEKYVYDVQQQLADLIIIVTEEPIEIESGVELLVTEKFRNVFITAIESTTQIIINTKIKFMYTVKKKEDI